MVVTEEDLAEARAVAENLTLEGVREVRQIFPSNFLHLNMLS